VQEEAPRLAQGLIVLASRRHRRHQTIRAVDLEGTGAGVQPRRVSGATRRVRGGARPAGLGEPAARSGRSGAAWGGGFGAAAGGVEEAARPGKIFPTQRPRVDGGPRPRLRRRRGVEDEAAAVEVHDHRELFEAAAAGDLRDEEAGAQVVGDGGEPPAR